MLTKFSVVDQDGFNEKWKKLKNSLQIELAPGILDILTRGVSDIHDVVHVSILKNYIDLLENNARVATPYTNDDKTKLKMVDINTWLDLYFNKADILKYQTIIVDATKKVSPELTQTPAELALSITAAITDLQDTDAQGYDKAGKALLGLVDTYVNKVILADRNTMIAALQKATIDCFNIASGTIPNNKDKAVEAEKLAYAYGAYKIMSDNKPISRMCTFLRTNAPRVLTKHPMVCQDEPEPITPPTTPTQPTQPPTQPVTNPGMMLEQAIKNLRNELKNKGRDNEALGKALFTAVDAYKSQGAKGMERPLMNAFVTTCNDKNDANTFSYPERFNLQKNVIYLLIALETLGEKVDGTLGVDVCSSWSKTKKDFHENEYDRICPAYLNA